MKILSLDIETRSSVDLLKCGVHRYVESPDFEILWVAYNWEPKEEYKKIDLSMYAFPNWLVEALTDPTVTKTAFNAAFERTCLAKALGVPMPAEQWDCTMVRAARAGWPMSLAATAKAMGLVTQKDTKGSALIRYFSVPCKPTKANGGRTWNEPEHAPEKWQEFGNYCVQDVKVEVAVRKKVLKVPISDFEQRLWVLDQKINDRGVRVDLQLAHNALRIHNKYIDGLKHEASEITFLENTNSPQQLIAWLAENDLTVVDLKKATVKDLIDDLRKGDVRRVLEIRQEMSKTSVKKYASMIHGTSEDSRSRGLFQFYGANRTGRWAGRRVQLQNLPQNHLNDLDLARRIVMDGDGELLELLFGNVPDTLSQLIRTSFVPEPGHCFIVADFSAIEARIIAWLAGEKWRMDVFATHGKIYEASASQMFKVPIESVTKGSELRQKAKIAELALGYQGSVGALMTMGALRMGLVEDELPELVALWRHANPSIVKLWSVFNDAAISCIQNPGLVINTVKNIKFFVKNGNMYIRLPSGRLLCYIGAKLNTNRFGKTGIVYMGMDQITKQWKEQETYGGKLTENIDQGIARDCLAESMLRLDVFDYAIPLHVHDEIVAEVEEEWAQRTINDMNSIMSAEISWAPGLPLTAESEQLNYYKK